jgi:nicotinamide phosphoribosyltransferase
VVESYIGLEAARVDQLAGRPNMLQPVWRDGELLRDWTFDEVRARAV